MSKKFRVLSVEFQVHEDSWNDGEGKLISIWEETHFPKRNTIEAALAEVPYFNEMMKNGKRVWANDPCDSNEFSRFDADETVDWNFRDNSPIVNPSLETIEKWKAGEIMLYSMHACAYVEVTSSLSKEDVKNFVNA